MRDKNQPPIYDKISKLEEQIQKIEGKIDSLGFAVAILILKVDRGFEVNEQR